VSFGLNSQVQAVGSATFRRFYTGEHLTSYADLLSAARRWEEGERLGFFDALPAQKDVSL